MATTIQMNDGTKATFSDKANVLSTYDADTATITFKVRTGEVITWVVEGIENLTDFQKKVFLFGLFRRIKSAVASTKEIADVPATIERQIASLKEGKFVVRGSDSDGGKLDNFLKAFAMVMSGKFPDAVKESNVKPHWANYEDASVVDEVLSTWSSLDKSIKTALRRNPFIMAAKAELDKQNEDAIDLDI